MLTDENYVGLLLFFVFLLGISGTRTSPASSNLRAQAYENDRKQPHHQLLSGPFEFL
jgi:hypothetical protein